MLDDLGHTALPASSASEAFEIIRREVSSVDLIITDQIMPNMTGVQLADAVLNEWPDLPVILASGYAEVAPSVRIDLPRLSKPFSQGELADELARILPATQKSVQILRFRAGAGPNI
jgi:YesN/AraC family two-component response regulator